MNDTPESDHESEHERTRGEELGAAASRLGGAFGRFARRVAAEAKPQAERGARVAAEQARAAAEAARPRIARAAAQARDFVQDHDDEIRRAAQAVAGIAVARVVPLPLRPIVVAVAHEFRRERPAATRESVPDAAAHDAGNDPPDDATPADQPPPPWPRPDNG